MWRRQVRTLIGAILLGLTPLMAACTGVGGGVMPSASVTTAIQGWEHYFRLDWAARPKPNGLTIDGYVYNKYGSNASVRILAQGLDPTGNLVSQKIVWVSGSVPALNRAFFNVAGLPPAATYRVSVWAFEFEQGNSNDKM